MGENGSEASDFNNIQAGQSGERAHTRLHELMHALLLKP
jgi:hypothetical protein